jgi:hypothetical protein
MGGHRVIYKHGQFIEKETGKRIIPVQGKEYIIIGLSDSFEEKDSKLKSGPRKTEKEKAEWAYNKFGDGNCLKLLGAGQDLIFRIGNSIIIEGDESNEYHFRCLLLEDLYLYKIRYRDGNMAKDWRLAECQCELTDCISGGLKITEKIVAESLNNLFTQTVMFFFNLQNSGATNVFNTFNIIRKDQ